MPKFGSTALIRRLQRAGYSLADATSIAAGGSAGGSDSHFADLDQAEVGQTVLYDGSVFRPGDLPAGGGGGAPSAFVDHVLALGPVAYYRMGDSGGIMADSSGGGWDGVYSSNTVQGDGFVAADSDHSRVFEGGHASIDLAPWMGGAVGTMVATVQCDDVAFGAPQTIMARYQPGQNFTNAEFVWRVSANGAVSFFTFVGSGSGDNAASASGLLTSGGIHDVAVSWDYAGGIRKLYVDGVPVATGAIANHNTVASPLTIGACENAGEPFFGAIDEVQVYDKVLSTAQIMGIREARLAA